MVFKEICQDLFTVPDDYYLAHCISADFALGAGIAVEFNRRFNMRNLLKAQHKDYLVDWDYEARRQDDSIADYGDCLLIGRVFNLVTKRNYWYKPTAASLVIALSRMKELALEHNVTKIAMPRIGCGLDRLEWVAVRHLIKEIFDDTDIEILVCIQ